MHHPDHFDHGSILEPAAPAPLGRTPETSHASSHVARPRHDSLSSDNSSCYDFSPRQSTAALPHAGGTFSPPVPPPSSNPGFVPQRSSRPSTLSDYNPNHVASWKPPSTAAQFSDLRSSNHHPEPEPLSTSARPESSLTGSSRYSGSSSLYEGYVYFLAGNGDERPVSNTLFGSRNSDVLEIKPLTESLVDRHPRTRLTLRLTRRTSSGGLRGHPWREHTAFPSRALKT